MSSLLRTIGVLLLAAGGWLGGRWLGTLGQPQGGAPRALPAAQASAPAPAPASAAAPSLPDEPARYDAMHERRPRFELADDGSARLNFAYLADGYRFDFEQPLAEQLPERIRKLDGQDVELEGFMLADEVVDGKVISFLLLRHQGGCCFGRAPRLAEVVRVEMKPGRAAPRTGGTILVRGRLSVEAQPNENGIVDLLFRIAGEGVGALR